MKRAWKLLLCGTVLLAGCRKKEETFQSYLRMTIDGVPVEATRDLRASGNHMRGTNLPTQILSISGGWTNGSEKGDIALALFDYTNTTGSWQLTLPGRATVWLETHNPNGILGGGTYEGWGANTRLTIGEVNNRYIKGTFSFVAVMNTGPGTSVIKKITDGSFHIKRDP